jgi:hypothetical protein
MSEAFVAMPIHRAPETSYAVYTVLMAALTAGMLLWWALSSERRRGPVLPLMLVSGALSVGARGECGHWRPRCSLSTSSRSA